MESGIEDAALFLNSLSNLKQSYLIVLECVEEGLDRCFHLQVPHQKGTWPFRKPDTKAIRLSLFGRGSGPVNSRH